MRVMDLDTPSGTCPKMLPNKFRVIMEIQDDFRDAVALQVLDRVLKHGTVGDRDHRFRNGSSQRMQPRARARRHDHGADGRLYDVLPEPPHLSFPAVVGGESMDPRPVTAGDDGDRVTACLAHLSKASVFVQ